MPLDPKQIEALSGLARAAAEWRKGCSNTEEGKPEGCGECTAAFLAAAKPHLLAAPEAVPALLSEREELLALLRPARAGNVFGPDDLRALLGEVGFDADGMCRDCGKGFRGGLDHCKPDCRLAAFLR
jgi:hypothetical protein